MGKWWFGAVAQWPVADHVEVGAMQKLTFHPSRILAAEVALGRDVGETIATRRDELADRMPNRQLVLEIGDFAEFFRRT